MNIRLVQMNITNSVEANVANALRLASGSALDEVDVLVFPEMFTTGYQLPKLEELAHTENDEHIRQFLELAAKTSTAIVLGSVAFKAAKGIENKTFIIDKNGKIISDYAKVHLFGLMNEPDYMIAGTKSHSFELDGIICSSIICYDLRFPELTRKTFLENQPAIIFAPMEWPKPRTETFRALVRARGIENQCFVVGCNRIGEENGSSFEGASLVTDPYGNIIADAGSAETALDVTIDLSLVAKARAHMNCLNDRMELVY